MAQDERKCLMSELILCNNGLFQVDQFPILSKFGEKSKEYTERSEDAFFDMLEEQNRDQVAKSAKGKGKKKKKKFPLATPGKRFLGALVDSLAAMVSTSPALSVWASVRCDRRLKNSLRWALVVATLTMRQFFRMYSWISALIQWSA